MSHKWFKVSNQRIIPKTRKNSIQGTTPFMNKIRANFLSQIQFIRVERVNLFKNLTILRKEKSLMTILSRVKII